MLKYYIVDAFTEYPFGGNTAGVVLLDKSGFPNEDLMLQVAAELRYSETVFVSCMEGGGWHLRYFTPRAEVALCGHATIAAFALLHAEGMAEGPCRVSTMAGELQVVAAKQVMMQMATPSIVRPLASDEVVEAYSALGLEPAALLPPEIATTGLPDIMVQVPAVEVLNGLHPDMDRVAALTTRLGAVSIHAFAFGHDGLTAHVRDFAPAFGVPEESATGTANAALTHYLASHGVIGHGEYRFLQGEAMGRPSVVCARRASDGTVHVGGPAAVVAEGWLRV